MWRFELPNLPTFMIKLLLLVLSIGIMINAIDNHSIGLGIISLIINSVDIKLERR